MTELTGVPVTAVARINVVWLDTLRGFSAITVAAAIVHQRMFDDAPTTVGIALTASVALLGLAWLVLRHLGGPLQLGLAGGVAAVQRPMA